MFLRNQDGFPSWGRQHSLGVLPTCLLTTYGWCRQWLARILWWLGEKKVLTPETNVLNVHLCSLYTLLKGASGTSSGTWRLCFQQSHPPPKPSTPSICIYLLWQAMLWLNRQVAGSVWPMHFHQTQGNVINVITGHMMSWGQIQELNMQLSGIIWWPTVTLLALNETKELEH